MLLQFVRLLAAMVRLFAIVACAVLAGAAVALASYNLPENDVLQVFVIFATFAVPAIVAWFLFQAIPPLSSESLDPPDVSVLDNGKLDNGNKTNTDQQHGPPSADQSSG